MTIKNTLMAGVDFESGSALASTDMNDTFNAALLQHIGSDQTGGTVGPNAGTEEKIGEVTVPPNRVGTGVLVIATGKIHAGVGENNAQVKLYGGESTVGTTNTEFKFISNETPIQAEDQWSIVFWVTGLNWSNVNYITISGKNGINQNDAQTSCCSVVVFGK